MGARLRVLARVPRRWRFAAGVGAVVVTAGLLALSATTGRGARDPVWERVQHAGLLRVCTDASYPPFEVVDAEGEYSGYDMDLARALGARWAVDVQFVNVHFDGLYDALRVGRCDVIVSALPYDRTMTRDVRYSQSYFDAGQVLMTRQDVQGLEGIVDLYGRRVAVELGAESHQLARRLARDKGLEIEIITVREPDELLPMLSRGDVDALLCDKVRAYSLLDAWPGARLVGPTLTDEPYVIAADPEAHELMYRVDEALAEWREGGYLEALAEKWF